MNCITSPRAVHLYPNRFRTVHPCPNRLPVPPTRTRTVLFQLSQRTITKLAVLTAPVRKVPQIMSTMTTLRGKPLMRA